MSGETKTPVLRFPDSAPWEVHPLGELANLYQPQTIGGSLFTQTGYTVYGANGPIGFYSRFNHEESQIIISCRGTCGTVNKTAPRSWINGNAMVVAPKPGKKLDKDFLLNVLKQTDFTPCILGSSQPQITRGPLSEVGIALAPTITEQQSIGGFFRELDALIAEREKALGKLESLKKAMLEKMFPQGDAKVPEVRFKGFEGEWEEKKLGDVCTGFDYGLNVAATKFDGRNRYIRITDIDDDSHAYNVLGAVSPDCNLSESKESIVCKGDILLARTGASVGKSYLYNENDGVMYFAGFLIRAHVSGEYDDFFVFCNTLTERYRQFVELTSQRSGQPGINAAEYKTFSFLTPVELAEQQAIGSFFRSLDALLAARREEAEKLKQLKKAFLERMFA